MEKIEKLQVTSEQKTALRLWTKALRSGDYNQGVGRLKNSAGEFCCLGVACDVVLRNNLLADCSWDGGVFMADGYEDGYNLPPAIRRVFGIQNNTMADLQLVDPSSKEWSTPIHMNDVKLYTFIQIADAIDATYDI